MVRLSTPTLTRRTLGAVLLAFVLVAVVLLGRDYWTFRQQNATLDPHREAALALAESLPAEPAAAIAVTEATEAQYRRLRERASVYGRPLEPVLLELTEAATGRVLYASAPLRAEPLPAQSSAAAEQVVQGRRYGAAQARAGPWQVRLLEPRLDTGTAVVLLAGQLGTPLLLALPLVLLPMWWAVSRGLRPLRQLVAAVQARRDDDFSPLGLDLRYAELQPLVGTVDRLAARAREALARERRFVHDAAHELRTPLAVIATQAHVLAHSPEAERASALARLEHGLQRASRRVEQLLVLARLEGPRVTGTPPPVDLAELLREALRRATPQARRRGIALALEGPDTLPRHDDELALLSIVDNLLDNALAHAAGATRIVATLAEDDAGLRLVVADDGPGVGADERDALFDAFARGRDAAPGGCGLGLAIVREAAQRLGGHARAAAGLDGRGLAIEIRLPPPGSSPG